MFRVQRLGSRVYGPGFRVGGLKQQYPNGIFVDFMEMVV